MAIGSDMVRCWTAWRSSAFSSVRTARRGMGVTAASRHELSVDPNGTSTLTFVIAGSAADKNAALNTYNYLAKNHATLLARKKARYASIIERARVRIPDQRLQEVYNWV